MNTWSIGNYRIEYRKKEKKEKKEEMKGLAIHPATYELNFKSRKLGKSFLVKKIVNFFGTKVAK